MQASGDTPWQRHDQAGTFSAVQGRRNGAPTTEFRVHCDYFPLSLMADVSRAVVEDSKPSELGGGGGGGGQQAGKTLVAGVGDTHGKRGLQIMFEQQRQQQEPSLMRSYLLAQAGSSRYRTNLGGSATVQLISGRLFLRGETVLINGGIAHFAPHSQLAVWDESRPQPTAITGTPVMDLLAHVATDLEGVCFLYCPEDKSLHLGHQQAALHDPVLSLSGKQHSELTSIVRLTSQRVRAALPLDFPVPAKALNAVSKVPPPSQPLDPNAKPLPPHRTLLVVGGQCLLRGNSLFLLSGLVHFAGSWRRVTPISQLPQQVPPGAIPRIVGASVLLKRLQRVSASGLEYEGQDMTAGSPRVQKRSSGENTGRNKDGTDSILSNISDVEEELKQHATLQSTSEESEPDKAMKNMLLTENEKPLILTNVWLYAQGGTVFIGSTPLLTDAAICVSPGSAAVNVDMQERLLSQKPPQSRRGAVRLFIQRGHFTLTPSGQLLATSGVAWMRAQKIRLGASPSDQLVVKGALPFIAFSGPKDSARFDGRDLLYKDGHLYLEDLTPLLAGGRVCVGQLEVPLEWLGAIEEDENQKTASMSGSSSQQPPQPDSSGAGPATESFAQIAATFDPSQAKNLVTDSVCLLDSDGNLHILRGRIQLPGWPGVLVDQGVAYFPPGCSVAGPQVAPRQDDPAAFPPPRFVGRTLLTRPKDARQWAKFVDQKLDRAMFEDARLEIKQDTLMLNDTVPLLRGCRLLISSQLFETKILAPAPQAREVSGSVTSHPQAVGFSGTYSVVTNTQTEALVFRLQARFPTGLEFLFSQ